MRHLGGMIGGEAECDGRTPTAIDDCEARLLEMIMHELPHVVGDGFLVVAGAGPRRIAEAAAHVGCDERELAGKQRHHAAPFVPGLRPSVEQHDRTALPHRHVVDSHAFEVGVVMRRGDPSTHRF